MTLAPGSRLGPYEITAKLGEGGMGEVWRATDSKLRRDVALKVLPQSFAEDRERLARFEREAQVLASLNHPNIAQIYGFEASGDTRALVMELVEGPTLAERLEEGPFPFNECLSVALQVAHALEEAHEKGIVHRDLKPQNVKAPVDGKVKVLDFGLAKAMDRAAGSAADLAIAPTLMQSPTLTAAHGTQLGVILGTAAYMAPEQARGVKVDKRADIWAFGVLFFEMLSGRRLFEGELVSDVLASVLKKEIDFETLPAEVPGALQQLLRRCLERNPTNRLHDIADARIALDELIASGGRDEKTPVAARAAPPRGMSRREVAAWGMALLAVVAALALWVGGGGTSPRAAVSAPPVVTRFSLVPKEKGFLRELPSLSPDGRTLVYSLFPDEGVAALWAYSFDTGTSRRLPGTDDGTQPFWSPDGRQIGFFAGGQLKSIDVATGLGQSLTRVADPRGGSWTRNGEILVSVDSASVIVRVSASSGESRPATDLAATPGAQSHRFPLALPGGEFLFTVTGAPEVEGIYWHPKGGEAAKKLVKDVSRATYDARGYLLWVRDSVLVGRRFDPAQGEFSGEMFPLAESVGVDEQMAAGTLFDSSSAGTIAYRTSFGQSVEMAWFDRRGQPLGKLASASTYREPMISPDGRQVAVQVVRRGSANDIWIFDAAGLDQSRRLTFDPSSADSPIWSPDGRWIAYTSLRSSGCKVLRKAADGSGEEQLLYEGGAGCWVDSWTPDGKALFFERSTADHGVDFWYLPLDGQRQPVPFLDGAANEAHGMVSPDGRFFAYVSDQTGIGQVYVRTIAAGENKWQISTNGGDWPAWSADGKELFFAASDRMLYAVPILGLSPFSFGSPAPLFRLRTPEPKISSNRTYFGVTPDGRFLVNQLADEEGDARIEVVMGWTPPASGGAKP